MKKILLIGKNGQLGWELHRCLLTLGNVIAADRNLINLTNPDIIRSIIGDINPDLIINAAAYTSVDLAEENEALAMMINGIAPGIIGEEAHRLKIPLIHFSTDYVFDGRKPVPYKEEDAAHPINVYGRTKLAGEQAIINTTHQFLIFRLSWLYGKRRQNFVRTIIELAKHQKKLTIVNDQIGAPTWDRIVAQSVTQLLTPYFNKFKLEEMPSGIFHLTASGAASRFDFANQILQDESVANYLHLANIKIEEITIAPINSNDYKTVAIRPIKSRLDCTKFAKHFGILLPDWRTTLKICLADMYPAKGNFI